MMGQGEEEQTATGQKKERFERLFDDDDDDGGGGGGGMKGDNHIELHELRKNDSLSVVVSDEESRTTSTSRWTLSTVTKIHIFVCLLMIANISFVFLRAGLLLAMPSNNGLYVSPYSAETTMKLTNGSEFDLYQNSRYDRASPVVMPMLNASTLLATLPDVYSCGTLSNTSWYCPYGYRCTSLEESLCLVNLTQLHRAKTNNHGTVQNITLCQQLLSAQISVTNRNGDLLFGIYQIRESTVSYGLAFLLLFWEVVLVWYRDVLLIGSILLLLNSETAEIKWNESQLISALHR